MMLGRGIGAGQWSGKRAANVQAAVDLVAARGVGIYPVVDLSRASVATYVAQDGTTQTAGVDEPRFDWSGGERALLVEPEATNLLTTSAFSASGSGYQDATLEDVPFAKSASGSAIRVTRTTTGVVNKGIASRGTGVSTAGVKYCFSATVRPGPYGAKIQHTAGLEVSITPEGVVTYSRGYGVFAAAPVIARSDALGDGCFRLSISGTPSANSGTQSVWIYGGSTHTNPVGAWSEYADFQIETGVDYPTSLIQTAGTPVTRAADVPSIWLGAGTYDVEITTDAGTTTLLGVAHPGGSYWPSSAVGRVHSVKAVEAGGSA